MHPEISSHRGIFFSDFFEHCISRVAVRKMPRWSRAQFRNVNGFREVHLEKRAFAEPERYGILRTLRGFRSSDLPKSADRMGCSAHSSFIFGKRTSRFKLLGNVVTVLGRKGLLNLNASPVTMHVPKAANIHQDVEPELLARAKCAKHLIMSAAMA